MREILFRGKRFYNGEWVEGSLIVVRNYTCIETVERDDRRVEKETIGQFTGSYDKNGKKIFEGDIIKCTNSQKGVYEIGRKMVGWIEYEEDGCYWYCKNNFQHYNDWAFNDDIEVIGNIYDNPELIGEKNDR